MLLVVCNNQDFCPFTIVSLEGHVHLKSLKSLQDLGLLFVHPNDDVSINSSYYLADISL